MGEAALIRACREMAQADARDDFEGAEIVGSPKEYWLGSRRLAARTVEIGLAAVLFRSEGIGTDYERHTLNSRGRQCATDRRIPPFMQVAAQEVPVAELIPCRTEIAMVEDTIENEIIQGCNQRQIAQTYALGLRSSWPTDWARVNAAINARWPKALDRIKRMAWDGSCFKQRAKAPEPQR